MLPLENGCQTPYIPWRRVPPSPRSVHLTPQGVTMGQPQAAGGNPGGETLLFTVGSRIRGLTACHLSKSGF